MNALHLPHWLSLLTLSLVSASASSASAFVAKRAPNGAPVRWTSSNVDFALSPTLDDIAPGSRNAVAGALATWKGAAEAPAFYTFHAGDGAAPGNDGTNLVTYAKDGYAAAGKALAVTVLTYDDASGHIVDCDIVLNGKYAFAALDRAARAASGSAAVSTEGGGVVGASETFDLVHVVAHEAGHALGLNDEPKDTRALMYPFTLPNDASMRAPASDDLAGVAELYATADLGMPAPPAGCAIGGTRAHGDLALAAIAIGALVIPIARRRARRAAPLALLGGFLTFLSLAASPADAQTRGASPSAIVAHAHADVTAANVVLRDGVLTTDIELTIRDCHRAACPARATATVWGGHAGGLTQEIAGVTLPSLGERVALTFEPQNAERAALLAE